MKKILVLLLIPLALVACYKMRMSKGGGQIKSVSNRKVVSQDILLSQGYKIEIAAQGLTFPSAVTFDNEGNLFVVEAGYSYGEVWREPKLIRISQNKVHDVTAKGSRNGPWTGVTFYDGNFYVSEGGQAEGGKILRISKNGEIKTLIDNLPSTGDHHTNTLLIKDNYIYFGQGTATNSAVVGPDNAEFGWLKRKKEFHDIPCKDLILTGENYESSNVLKPDSNEKVLTGAYSPYGTSTTQGQVVRGKVPCTGAILRIPIEGGNIETVSWGLRNPFGIALSPDGKIYTSENGYDDRGSRPVWGAGDVLWEVKQDMWYGWPDFSEGKPIGNDEEFKAPSKEKLKPLIQKLPNDPPKPVAVFGVHSSSSGFDFSKSAAFGFEGEAFVAQFGDMAPKVGKVLKPVGFKIVRVNVRTGIIKDFAVNKGKRNGPASWLKSGGLERPLSVKFDSSGGTLYVVDFGILKMTEKGPEPQENTGVIWKITKDEK
jgi:glucose/arabinose dehydrogenase